MKSKKNTESVKTFSDHEVIVPPHKLRKMVRATTAADKDFDPVAQAEAALAALSTEFSDWMETERARLDAARNSVVKSGFSTERRDQLFRAAHDIKGQAATFGYPLVAPIAESLCRLLEHTPHVDRIPIQLINQHVDAVSAVMRESENSRLAQMLGRKLREVSDEFLIAENKDRPDALEAILGPPLSPAG